MMTEWNKYIFAVDVLARFLQVQFDTLPVDSFIGMTWSMYSESWTYCMLDSTSFINLNAHSQLALFREMDCYASFTKSV